MKSLVPSIKAYMKNFSSCLEAKVSLLWHLGTSTAQPWKQTKIKKSRWNYQLRSFIYLTFSAGGQLVFTSRQNVLNWTYKKNVPLNGSTKWVKSSSPLLSICPVPPKWPLMEPLVAERGHTKWLKWDFNIKIQLSPAKKIKALVYRHLSSNSLKLSPIVIITWSPFLRLF